MNTDIIKTNTDDFILHDHEKTFVIKYLNRFEYIQGNFIIEFDDYIRVYERHELSFTYFKNKKAQAEAKALADAQEKAEKEAERAAKKAKKLLKN